MIYKKIIACIVTSVLVSSSVYAQESFTFDPGELSRSNVQNINMTHKDTLPRYVEGEILVKFKEDKINLAKGEGGAKKAMVTLFRNVDEKEVFKDSNIVVYNIQGDKSVEDAIKEFEEDSSVEYAQPNYLYKLQSVSTSYADFAKQWAMNNTGQMTGGVSGTADADIDAVEAWTITDDTNTGVIVAVIDSGVSYFHPDLAANMWVGSTCLDPNGQTIVGGCMYGYDTFADDIDPRPDTVSGSIHGTHVAGIIAAADNTMGVIGVDPHARIMAIKSAGLIGSEYGSRTSDVIEAINFARHNNADIINMSLGSNENDLALAAAIEAFPGLAVVAAGNDGTDNDITPMYPASNTNENIVSVAATDQNDALADFSNYGVTSVDVGAPGVNIYSTTSDSVAYSEDVQTVVPPSVPLNFVRDGNFGTRNAGSGNNVFIGDTNQLPYATNHTSHLFSPTIDLSSYGSDDLVYMDFLVYCDTEYSETELKDYMVLGFSSDGSNFSTALMDTDYSGTGDAAVVFDEYVAGALASGSGEKLSGGYWAHVASLYPISPTYRTSDFRFQFMWKTNDVNNNHEGCYVDDIVIHGSNSEIGNAYAFEQGTSMAAPHVAGLAALLLDFDPSLSTAELKALILNSGDPISSLAGKTVTGKRINAFNAVNELSVAMHHFNVTGSNTQQAGASQNVTITATDSHGNVNADYQGDHAITLSGAGAAPDSTVPTCKDKNNANIAFGTPTTLTFTNGVATCAMTLYKKESVQIDVTDGTYTSTGAATYDLDVVVSAANVSADDTLISVSPVPAYAGGSAEIVVTARDVYRNQLAGGGDTVVVNVNGTNVATPTVTDENDGTYSATHAPTNVGTDMITGTINGTTIGLDDDGDAVNGTFTLSVVEPVMQYMVVTGINTQMAGDAQTITITAKNSAGNTYASYTGDHAVTLTGAQEGLEGTAPTCKDKSNANIAFGTPTTLTFTNGVATCAMTLYKKESVQVDVSDGTYNSAGATTYDLDVAVSAAEVSSAKTALSVTPDPTYKNHDTTLTVTAKDVYLNQLSGGGDTVIIEVTGANTATPSVTDKNDGTYTAIYAPTNIGTDLITAKINGENVEIDKDGEPDGIYNLEVLEEQEVDDDEPINELEIEKPAMDFSGKLKNLVLSKNKTAYIPRDKVKFKGNVQELAGGTVEIKTKSEKKTNKKKTDIDDSGKWNKEIEFDKDGTWNVKFTFFDKNGEKIDTIGSYNIKVDTEDPLFTDLPDRLNKKKGSTVWFEAQDSERFKKFKVYLDGQTQTIYPESKVKDNEVVKGLFMLPQDITAGKHVMDVKAYDKAGNSVKKSVLINIW